AGLTANEPHAGRPLAERRGAGSLDGLASYRQKENGNEEPEASGEGEFGQTHPARRHRPRSRPYVCARVGPGAMGAASDSAGSQPQLPFRCFAQVGVDHVVFGPDSFFLPNTVQGPTSFSENAGPTIVTYPLYHGTSQGRDVSYVITDASNLSVAQALGVNYTTK